MSRRLRKLVFWLHLVSGVVAGLVIALMSVTGVVLAFQPQIVAWADEDARLGALPAPGAERLSVDELYARAHEALDGKKPTGITLYPEPGSAVLVRTGRSGGVYVDPHTGEVRKPGAKGARDFFHVMMVWHRWLGADGEGRPMGRAITGACNAAFLLLALTGLYLWFPRKWTKQALRAVLWFRRGLSGKPRDFNWHNVIGLWCLPVLVVLTASGMVISYRWASDLVYTLTGDEAPAGGGRPPLAQVELPARAPGAERLPLEQLFERAKAQVPAFEELTLQLGGGGSTASTFVVRAEDRWPLFSSENLWLDPFSGEVVRREGFDEASAGRKLRSWLRFLHTGEALGWPGQLIAALASLGGTLLVWTGLALAYRRLSAYLGHRRRDRGA